MANDNLDPKEQEGKTSSIRDALSRAQESSGGAKTESAPAKASSSRTESGKKEIYLRGPKNLDRALFCRQFATLIEVGIPILRALQLLAKRTSHPKLRAAIADTARAVEEGQTLHQAMAAHTSVFSPLVVNILRVGEVGGILEASLIRLAEIMETKTDIARKIRSASMYPIFAMTIAVIVIGIIMVKAVPMFSEVFAGLGQADELPMPTRILMGLSEMLQATWFVWLVALILGIVGLKLFFQTPSGRYVSSLLALRIPILRGINQEIAVARFARTLGSLVTAGIPLSDAVSIAADTNENLIVGDALKQVHQAIDQGERMGPPMHDAGVFPPLVVDMIEIGEESGTLDRMLNRIADIYDAEVEATISGLSSIIEPLLIVFLGLTVGFIALAVLLPYFKLVSVIE